MRSNSAPPCSRGLRGIKFCESSRFHRQIGAISKSDSGGSRPMRGPTLFLTAVSLCLFSCGSSPHSP